MAEGAPEAEPSDAVLSELPPPVVDAWSIAVALVGVSLWAQIFWSPLSARLQAGAAEPWRILPLVASLGAVGTALVWRAAWLRLFVVPVSLVPGLLMVPGVESAVAGRWGLFRIGATLAIYLFFAGLSLRRDNQIQDWMELDDEVDARVASTDEAAVGEDGTERPAGLYPYFIRVRLVWMVGLFVALLWGVFGSAATTSLLAENFTGHPVEATMFLTVLMTFVWCLAVYFGVLQPVANVEYRLRKRSRQLNERPDAKAAGRRLAWRALLGVLGVAGVVVFGV